MDPEDVLSDLYGGSGSPIASGTNPSNGYTWTITSDGTTWMDADRDGLFDHAFRSADATTYSTDDQAWIPYSDLEVEDLVTSDPNWQREQERWEENQKKTRDADP